MDGWWLTISRITKCINCEVKDKSEKIKIQVGKNEFKYIHNDCIPAYEEQQKQKQIEKQQFDELYEYLRSLHNAIEIPTWNLKRIHELKKSKNITYKIILDAYKYAEDKIKWFIENVNEKNDASGINAGITLMIKHGLNPVYKQEQARKKREEEQKRQLEQTTSKDMSYEIKVNKNKKDEMDISEWL